MPHHDDDPPARAGARIGPAADRAEPRTRARAGRPPLGPAAQARLGQSLGLYYASLTDQPLPERFTRLLDDLSAADTTRRGT